MAKLCQYGPDAIAQSYRIRRELKYCRFLRSIDLKDAHAVMEVLRQRRLPQDINRNIPWREAGLVFDRETSCLIVEQGIESGVIKGEVTGDARDHEHALFRLPEKFTDPRAEDARSLAIQGQITLLDGTFHTFWLVKNAKFGSFIRPLACAPMAVTVIRVASKKRDIATLAGPTFFPMSGQIGSTNEDKIWWESSWHKILSTAAREMASEHCVHGICSCRDSQCHARAPIDDMQMNILSTRCNKRIWPWLGCAEEKADLVHCPACPYVGYTFKEVTRHYVSVHNRRASDLPPRFAMFTNQFPDDVTFGKGWSPHWTSKPTTWCQELLCDWSHRVMTLLAIHTHYLAQHADTDAVDIPNIRLCKANPHTREDDIYTHSFYCQQTVLNRNGDFTSKGSRSTTA